MFILLGRLAGLVAWHLVMAQLLLIGRVGWIERRWGHDRLSRWHHKNGIVAWALLAIHPPLMVIGYGGLGAVLSLPRITLALVGYAMFLIIVPLSFAAVRRRLPYQVWYAIHALLYGAILLVFWHQLANGSNLQHPALRLYWQALFYGVLATILWYRFIRPTLVSWQSDFRVAKIVRETHDVVSLYISSRPRSPSFGEPKPGQFIIVRFLTPGFWYEAHPFTLTRIKNNELRITPKAVGDYTQKLPNIPVGTKAIIEGPLGKFTPDRAGDKPVLLIAGGIGITPIRMLFEKFPDAPLIYAARSQDDFALRGELDQIGHVYYTTDRLTPEYIKSVASDIASRFVYLCGPPPMMSAVREMLMVLGVPKRDILYEKFELG